MNKTCSEELFIEEMYKKKESLLQDYLKYFFIISLGITRLK